MKKYLFFLMIMLFVNISGARAITFAPINNNPEFHMVTDTPDVVEILPDDTPGVPQPIMVQPTEVVPVEEENVAFPVEIINETPTIVPIEPENTTEPEVSPETGHNWYSQDNAEVISVSPSEEESDLDFELKHTINFAQAEDDGTSKKVEVHFANEINDDLKKKIEESDTNLGEILSPVASKIGQVMLSVEEEGDDQLLYKIKPISSKISLGETEDKTKKEIVVLPEDKKIDIKVKERVFYLDDVTKFDYSELDNEDNDYAIGLDIKTSADSGSSHVQVKPQDDCLELYFDEEQQQKIKLCHDLAVEPEATYIVDKDKKYQLTAQPDFVLASANQAVESEDSQIVDVMLSIENEKPVYDFSIVEKHKFLWFFPIDLKANLKIDATDNYIESLDYAWQGMFFKDKNYALDIRMLPNLVITGVTISPLSLHTGEKASYEVTIKNIGSKRAYHKYGDIAIELKPLQNFTADSSDYNYSLDPGETKTYHLDWDAVICEVPVDIVIDPQNKIEEVHEDDNTWSGILKCAPTDAPDLVVDSVVWGNNSKRVGVPNNVKFTIKNEGTQGAPEFTAFYRWDGLSSSILVPPLAAGDSWSSTQTVTPKSCDGIKLELDTSDVVDEISEDNNYGFEDGDVILACTKRPDLFVEHVWWKAGGVTVGDIHAGEEIWFEYKVRNEPETFTTNDACLSGFNAALKLNGQVIATENLGWIGCVPNYGYNHPDYWMRRGHFTYTPQCNGEHLTIEIDPNNAVLEGRENNNTWTMDIVCAAPPIVATPTE